MSDVLVLGGSGSPVLTRRICEHLGAEPIESAAQRFSEGSVFVRVLSNVRGRDVYVVQSVAFPVNDNLVELLFWVDALKRASAASVTAVMPFFAYAKGDKKDEPRVSIRARVCADCIEAAGADRVVTMDLHAGQIQGFFKVPVDDLYALPVLCDAIRERGLRDCVVVSPDAGFAKKARTYALHLGAEFALADKVRRAHDERAEVMGILGDVRGRDALLVDEAGFSWGTIARTAESLVDAGARSVRALVTHAHFTPEGAKRIADSPLELMLVTDTIETSPAEPPPNVEVVSVAGLFADAIRRIDGGESVSVLFPDAPR